MHHQRVWPARTLLLLGLIAACSGKTTSDSTSSKLMASGSAGSQHDSSSSPVMGTGNDCDSYSPPRGNRCGSWYCGVTLAALKSAIEPAAVCGESAELICTGSAVAVVADCARTLKLSTPFASNEELRAPVRACALKDAQLQQGVRDACLDCIFDGVACTANNCLAQCLTGNGAECDSCRLEAKCDQMSFSCAGLPWPRD
jgi:hypothetical protein